MYDLTGDGRTVVKANYGLYWHNPGVGVSANGNPNTPASRRRRTGTTDSAAPGCIAGDRQWQPGEETSFVVAALDGALGVDPNIKAPYSHEGSVWFERQLTDTMGARAGFVYKTEDDLIDQYQPGRGPEAFTVPFDFVDIGLDGVRGTGDDSTIRMLGLPTANQAQLPEQPGRHEHGPQYSRFKTFEVFDQQALQQQVVRPGGRQPYVATRASRRISSRTTRTCRACRTARRGSSRRPEHTTPPGASACHRSCGISRAVNFARTVTVTAPARGLIATSGTGDRATAYVEPANSNREDNIWVFDISAEKTVNLIGRTRVASVPGSLQHHEQPRVGNDQPRDGS